MNVIINPYYRSVKIDEEEIKQVVLPFPDYLNHLASVSCTFDSTSHKITDVQGVHRYVSHFIEKEYYYAHLPTFIDWFYAEKDAQVAKANNDDVALANAIASYVNPLIAELSQHVTDNNVTRLYYNTNLKTINLVKSTINTLTALIPEVTDSVSGLMTSADILALRDLQVKVNSLIAQGVWRATFKSYSALTTAYPELKVNSTNWQENDFVYVDEDENYNASDPVRTSYIVILKGADRVLKFRRTENTESVAQATNDSFGVVKGVADREGGIYVETDGTMSLIGWDRLNSYAITMFLTEEDFIVYESPKGSGKYPDLIGRMVVIES